MTSRDQIYPRTFGLHAGIGLVELLCQTTKNPVARGSIADSPLSSAISSPRKTVDFLKSFAMRTVKLAPSNGGRTLNATLPMNRVILSPKGRPKKRNMRS